MHDVARSHWHEPRPKRAGFGKFGRPKTPYTSHESRAFRCFADMVVSKQSATPAATAVADGARRPPASSPRRQLCTLIGPSRLDTDIAKHRNASDSMKRS